MARFSERLQSFWDRAARAGSTVHASILAVVSWLVLVVLFCALLSELFFDDEPDAGMVVILVSFLFIAALFLQHAGDLLARLKKLGPLELFEERYEQLLFLSRDPQLRFQIGFDLESLRTTQRALSPRESFEYEQWDRYISHLEFSGIDPGKFRLKYFKERYFYVLWFVGAVAYTQKDWPRATARFERLQEISEGAYNPLAISYGLGAAYLDWGIHVASTEKSEYFDKAKEHLSKVVQGAKDHFRAWSRLAYAQDELQLYGLAVESNGEALKIRPQYAPARYNMAISYIKLRKLDKALEAFQGLSPGDEQVAVICRTAQNDHEIAPLRNDPILGPKLAELLQTLSC
jgi:tetratricopeptide (TPR) repeat protein